MKFLSITLIAAAALLAGCSSTANNSNSSVNNANLRGTNTNTGYVTNTETTAKPTVPVNPTVVGPASPATHTGPAVKPTETSKATK